MTTPAQDSKPDGNAVAFRIVAYIEATTFLLLLAASIIKRGFEGPDLVVAMGPIHGIAFLIYLVLVLMIREGQGWHFWRTVLVVFLAAVPLGGFWAGSHLKNDEMEPAPR